MGWWENSFRLHTFIAGISSVPSGISFPHLLGSGLIALELALGYFSQQCTNGVWSLLRVVGVVTRSKRLSTWQYSTYLSLSKWSCCSSSCLQELAALAGRHLSGHPEDCPLTIFSNKKDLKLLALQNTS